jgi:DNA-binding PadR family transcriptional regulator
MSTNSYAVLGMLALKTWTPYELTQQFRRSLAWCWPVSERQLYDEPEKLVAAGWAKVRTTDDKSRSRREYSITAAGRKALREWLGTPTAPPRTFNEPLLRVLYADQGGVDDLMQALAGLREELADQAAIGRRMTDEYRDGLAPFPERAHLVALFADLNQRIASAIDDWAAEAIDEVSAWPTTKGLGATPSTKARFDKVAADAAARV